MDRLKKTGCWSEIAYEDKEKGLDALKDLLGVGESIVRKSKYGYVELSQVSHIAFSFQTKFLRVKGNVAMAKQ